MISTLKNVYGKVNSSGVRKSNSQSYEINQDDRVVFLLMERIPEKGEINQELTEKVSDIAGRLTYFERSLSALTDKCVDELIEKDTYVQKRATYKVE